MLLDPQSGKFQTVTSLTGIPTHRHIDYGVWQNVFRCHIPALRMTNSTEKFEDSLRKLGVKTTNGKKAPNKPCLLLAVFDQFERTDKIENKFRYESRLLTCFDRYYQVCGQVRKRRSVSHPYIRLVRDGFWHLHNKNGDEWESLKGLEIETLADKGPKITESVEYASLKSDYFECLKIQKIRNRLRHVLIDRWLPEHKARIWNAIRQTQDLIRFQDIEISLAEVNEYSEFWRKVVNHRDSKFRSRVLKAYDYQCAATGWRLMPFRSAESSNKYWTTLLEAAHIIPVSDSRNNAINNGIALTPTLHLAMDRHLIAPGPDHLWHVSDYVLNEVDHDDGARQISELHEKQMILPIREEYHPTYSALEWSLVHLLKP